MTEDPVRRSDRTAWTTAEQARAYAEGLLVGQRTRLRPATAEDLELLGRWWNEPGMKVLQDRVVRPRPHQADVEAFARWSANDADGAVGFAIEDLGGTLVGHAVLHSAAMPERSATFAIMLADEHQGRGLGPDATNVLLRYGFAEMGLHRIGLSVYAYNDRAIAAYRRAGFVEEGRLRESVFHDGAFHDQVLMSVLAPEWWAAQR